jgi:hypothetical protein
MRFTPMVSSTSTRPALQERNRSTKHNERVQAAFGDQHIDVHTNPAEQQQVTPTQAIHHAISTQLPVSQAALTHNKLQTATKLIVGNMLAELMLHLALATATSPPSAEHPPDRHMQLLCGAGTTAAECNALHITQTVLTTKQQTEQWKPHITAATGNPLS